MTKKTFLLVVSEPLLRFLCIGLLIFIVFEFVGRGGPTDPSKQIVVSAPSLIEHLRARSNVFATNSVDAPLESLSEDELKRLIDDFVRHEALYREAKALGLDEKDIGIRQRMISQLEFINQSLVSSAIDFSDQELQAYLDKNRQRYSEPASVTFTHVFIRADGDGDADARTRAQEMMKKLNGSSDGTPIPFHQAPNYGDRFLYHQNYVNQEEGEIRSHFGSEMQRRIFALHSDDQSWHGPFRSTYGYHLVLMGKKTASYLPGLEELRPRLEMDAYQTRLDQELEQIERAVVNSYSVELDHTVQERLVKGTSEFMTNIE